ncbi:hypothetical protein CMUS01_14105 [Colletotrichum musicola]|uniref:Uncharacterized protein n=1 Tax=Colletotrichum musicola TaxID=2175873 RepID=A0A8H6MSL4_9PEZI|nr:hypothetical protein CMUS01_14105 [Colletotrichum musicola]
MALTSGTPGSGTTYHDSPKICDGYGLTKDEGDDEAPRETLWMEEFRRRWAEHSVEAIHETSTLLDGG